MTLNRLFNIIITILLIAIVAISLISRHKINKFQSDLEDLNRTELIHQIGDMNRKNK